MLSLSLAPLQATSPLTQGSGNEPSLGAFHSQPLHADTFTDVLASVAAQWTPAEARQPEAQWSSQPKAQWTSSLPEPSPFLDEGSAHGSAHGGNYYHTVRPPAFVTCTSSLPRHLQAQVLLLQAHMLSAIVPLLMASAMLNSDATQGSHIALQQPARRKAPRHLPQVLGRVLKLQSTKQRMNMLLQMDWPGSASLPEQGTLTSMVSGSPVDLHPNSLSYPDARMESYREDSGRSAYPSCALLPSLPHHRRHMTPTQHSYSARTGCLHLALPGRCRRSLCLRLAG